MTPKRGIAIALASLLVIPILMAGAGLLVGAVTSSSANGTSCPVAGTSTGNGDKPDPRSIQIGGKEISNEQLSVATHIVGDSFARQFTSRDAKIALMVALMESRLRNLKYGDQDSLGVFQQRPSQNWGTPEQITNVDYATNKFLDALGGVDDRESMSLLEVAIAVQRPNRQVYENPVSGFNSWEDEANQLLAVMSTSIGGSVSVSASLDCVVNNGVPGKVVIASGANSPGKPMTPQIIAFLEKVSDVYGKELIVTTGTNHSFTTVNRNVSDHSSGNAADIGMVANGGTKDGPVGDAIAFSCLVAMGYPQAQAADLARQGGLWTRTVGEFRIQCIWKTDDGGNHHDHVHMGVARVSG